MTLKAQAQALREHKRRELELLYPALRRAPQPAPRTKPAPPTPVRRGKRIVLGRDSNELVFSPDAPSRFLHTHVIGVPGSGKSNCIVHGIRQDLLNNAAVVLFDPHGSHPDSGFTKTLRSLGSNPRG